MKEELSLACRAKRMVWAMAEVVLFLVLTMFLTIFLTMPFAVFIEKFTSEASRTDIYCQMLNEVLMVASICILLRFWGIPFGKVGFSLKGGGRSLWTGALFIACLYAAGFGLSLWLGEVEVTGVVFSPASLLLSLLLYLLVAVAEELLVRGFVLGRLLDGGFNRFVALFLSAVLFSLLHFFNPSFAFVPFLNILLAGLFLGASYIYTRNLCFPITLHWFWNWIQGPLLGYNVSGNEFGYESLLTLRFPEENLINGGAFGFEGSLLCSLLQVVGIALIIGYYERRG